MVEENKIKLGFIVIVRDRSPKEEKKKSENMT